MLGTFQTGDWSRTDWCWPSSCIVFILTRRKVWWTLRNVLPDHRRRRNKSATSLSPFALRSRHQTRPEPFALLGVDPLRAHSRLASGAPGILRGGVLTMFDLIHERRFCLSSRPDLTGVDELAAAVIIGGPFAFFGAGVFPRLGHRSPRARMRVVGPHPSRFFHEHAAFWLLRLQFFRTSMCGASDDWDRFLKTYEHGGG